MSGAGDAMEAEFDVVAGWTEQVVAQLGPEYAVVAGCRGSGSPASLSWLAEALQVSASRSMLDVGSGVGGPAAWVAEHFGVRPVCVEPMPAAAQAGHRLFRLPSVVGWGHALPFRDAAFDVVWCLGVLCTTSHRDLLLREVRRVLGTSGRLGLLVFQAEGPLPTPLPEGNDFPTERDLLAGLAGADLTMVEAVDADALPAAPLAWQSRVDRVDQRLADAHAQDPRWTQAQEQSARVARLLSEGHVRGRLLHAVAT